MKLIILIAAVVIVAGHFIPISTKHLASSACASVSKDVGHYSILTGKLSSFKKLQAYIPSGGSVNPATAACGSSSNAKLYLW